MNDTISKVIGIDPGTPDASQVNENASKDNGGIFGWLKKLFSAETAGRFTIVVIGVVLVGVAVFFLTGTDKIVMQVASDAAKDAGKLAVAA